MWVGSELAVPRWPHGPLALQRRVPERAGLTVPGRKGVKNDPFPARNPVTAAGRDTDAAPGASGTNGGTPGNAQREPARPAGRTPRTGQRQPQETASAGKRLRHPPVFRA